MVHVHIYQWQLTSSISSKLPSWMRRILPSQIFLTNNKLFNFCLTTASVKNIRWAFFYEQKENIIILVFKKHNLILSQLVINAFYWIHLYMDMFWHYDFYKYLTISTASVPRAPLGDVLFCDLFHRLQLPNQMRRFDDRQEALVSEGAIFTLKTKKKFHMKVEIYSKMISLSKCM